MGADRRTKAEIQEENDQLISALEQIAEESEDHEEAVRIAEDALGYEDEEEED